MNHAIFYFEDGHYEMLSDSANSSRYTGQYAKDLVELIEDNHLTRYEDKLIFIKNLTGKEPIIHSNTVTIHHE